MAEVMIMDLDQHIGGGGSASGVDQNAISYGTNGKSESACHMISCVLQDNDITITIHNKTTDYPDGTLSWIGLTPGQAVRLANLLLSLVVAQQIKE